MLLAHIIVVSIIFPEGYTHTHTQTNAYVKSIVGLRLILLLHLLFHQTQQQGIDMIKAYAYSLPVDAK